MRKYKVGGIILSNDPQFKPFGEKTAEEVGLNLGNAMLRDKGCKAEVFLFAIVRMNH